jgi:hypothetical protein
MFVRAVAPLLIAMQNAGEAQVHEFREQIHSLERQIEESKSRESQLRLEQRVRVNLILSLI